MDCNSLDFSPGVARQRLQRAEALFGPRVVRRLLGWALYLLGAKRRKIAQLLQMPVGTLYSLVRALRLRGLSALEDGRSSTSSFKPPVGEPLQVSIDLTREHLTVRLGVDQGAIRIPAANRLQRRTVLLTLFSSGLISRQQAARGLELSEDRTAKLGRQLRRHDVQTLIDRRRGQQHDYRFTAAVKAELIQQFLMDLLSEGRTSAEQLSRRLQERCGLQLSSRSIAYHLSRLGLSQIRPALIQRLAGAKKTPAGREEAGDGGDGRGAGPRLHTSPEPASDHPGPSGKG